MKEYILIDNSDYGEHFLENLKEYIPITTDMYLKSLLESKGVKTIGISEYLSQAELRKICCDSSVLVDYFIDELDKNNRDLYGQIFGEKEVRLFYATMKYLFKRFMISCLQFLRGMELVLQNNNIIRLNYLHSGNFKYLCGNLKQNAFFFPNDILWRILQYWDCPGKPEVVFLKAALKKSPAEAKGYGSLARVKGSLRPIKRYIQELVQGYGYSSSKKTLLFLKPLYDLSFISNSAEMRKKYNILEWNVDYKTRPEFLKDQPVSSFFDGSFKKQISGLRPQEILNQFSLNIEGLEKLVPVQNFDFLSFVTPLITSFLEKKLVNIVRYWRAIDNIHKPTKIDALFWGNSPHRYPGGIVVEFCRIHGIPVIGMQHGGLYGSNRTEKTHFDLDFEKCNFYFSYGFDNRDLKKTYPNENEFPQVVPVGSPLIFNLAKRYGFRYTKKFKVKVIYTVDFFNPFFWKFEGRLLEDLFSFQRQVIGLLSSYTAKYPIILKFLPENYKKHPLKPYLESIEPHRFKVIDDIFFSRTLEKYEAEIILLDSCSTPLSQSLVTKSEIIVHNDKCMPLTEEAFKLLNKRAFVCDSLEEYLEQLEKCLNGKVDKKDLGNGEFLKKYCIYKGDPGKNIVNKINMLGDKMHDEVL